MGRTCRDAKPVYVGAGAINTFYAWLRLAYGFKDENIRPYNFNSAPFIMNKTAIQQGYLTAEPYEIERQGHFKPNVFLLSDYGYDTYSTLIVTRADIVEKNPDLVQRFVDASAIGWYHYLYGDNSKANALIKAENPDITDDQIAFSIAPMKQYGVVDSGDTLTLGIGAMTECAGRTSSTRWWRSGWSTSAPTIRTPTPCSSSTRGWGSICALNDLGARSAMPARR